jgi:quercetin dioxygenase-like cupin family protein
MRPLFVDDRNYATTMVRMDPAVRYPSHRHTETEELFMLEGDLVVEGKVMRAGDYCRGESGSIHGEVYTETGAVFLVLASGSDEILG